MEAGGDVDLYEPGLEPGVQQDVEPEQLVAAVPGVEIYILPGDGNIFRTWEWKNIFNQLMEIYIFCSIKKS